MTIKDSQLMISIYKRYLDVTSDLVEILERNYSKIDSDTNEIKEKRNEFCKHAQNLIQKCHEDVHMLFRIAYEIKELEQGEQK